MIDMELQTHRERENLARIHDVLGGPETWPTPWTWTHTSRVAQ